MLKNLGGGQIPVRNISDFSENCFWRYPPYCLSVMFWRQAVSSLVIWACPLHSPGHLSELSRWRIWPPTPPQGYPIHACPEFMDLSGSGVWLPLFQALSQAMKQQGLAYKEVLYLLTGFSHLLSWWKVNSSLRPLVDALLKQQCTSLVAVVFCTCVSSSSTLRWLKSVVCWMRQRCLGAGAVIPQAFMPSMGAKNISGCFLDICCVH